MVISQSTTSLQTLYRQAVEVSSDGKLYNIFFYWKVSMSYHSDLTNNYQIFIINWLFVLNCKHNKSTNHDNNNNINSSHCYCSTLIKYPATMDGSSPGRNGNDLIFENIWFSKSPKGNDFNAQSKGKSKLENCPNSSLFPRNFSPEILNIFSRLKFYK